MEIYLVAHPIQFQGFLNTYFRDTRLWPLSYYLPPSHNLISCVRFLNHMFAFSRCMYLFPSPATTWESVTKPSSKKVRARNVFSDDHWSRRYPLVIRENMLSSPVVQSVSFRFAQSIREFIYINSRPFTFTCGPVTFPYSRLERSLAFSLCCIHFWWCSQRIMPPDFKFSFLPDPLVASVSFRTCCITFPSSHCTLLVLTSFVCGTSLLLTSMMLLPYCAADNPLQPVYWPNLSFSSRLLAVHGIASLDS